MAGKAPVFCGRALYCTLDKLTKNQLIDLAVSMTIAMQGTTFMKASDSKILDDIAARMVPIWRERKDNAIDLAAYYDRVAKVNEIYAQQAAARAAGTPVDHDTAVQAVQDAWAGK